MKVSHHKLLKIDYIFFLGFLTSNLGYSDSQQISFFSTKKMLNIISIDETYQNLHNLSKIQEKIRNITIFDEKIRNFNK